MGLIEIGAVGIVVIFALVVVGKLLHPASTVAEAARDESVVGGSVGSFVAAVHRCESRDDPAYVAAVDRLRTDPAAAAAIEQLYGDAHPDLKPALLLAAAAAGAAARRFLAAVASSLPGGRRRVDEAIEDSRLRLTALDGLEQLARAGDEEAWRDVERLASSADRAVQAGAVAALKFGGQDEALARLRASLPPDRRYLFDIERPDVRDVPKIADPRRHLAGPERSAGARPHPDGGPTPGSSRRQPPRRGAPTAGEKNNG